jgi:hypothetical protein
MAAAVENWPKSIASFILGARSSSLIFFVEMLNRRDLRDGLILGDISSVEESSLGESESDSEPKTEIEVEEAEAESVVVGSVGVCTMLIVHIRPRILFNNAIRLSIVALPTNFITFTNIAASKDSSICSQSQKRKIHMCEKREARSEGDEDIVESSN